MPPESKPWHEILPNVTNNYRFVPFDAEPMVSQLQVGAEEPARQLRHDIPMAGSCSGVITMDWIARTPVLFGTYCAVMQHGQSRRAAVPQRLHAGPDAPFIIPGRSLKGMIRQVLRIATKGKAGPINDFRPARRDPTYQRSRLPVAPRGGMPKPKSGWLTIDRSGAWTILECTTTPVSRAEIGLTMNQGRLSIIHQNRRNLWTRSDLGWLNVTGPFARKQNEHRFSNPTGRTIDVPSSALADFFMAYSRPGRAGPVADGNLAVWAREYLRHAPDPAKVREAFGFDTATLPTNFRPDDPPGIPVWFYDLGGQLIIGMTQIMRFPYRRTIGDALLGAQPAARAPALDWSEAMLGRIDETETTSLKGRVSFGIACEVRADGAPTQLWPGGINDFVQVEQMQPRPGYFGFYLRRKDMKGGPPTYDDANGVAAGRKRYPAWSEAPATSQAMMLARASVEAMPTTQQPGESGHGSLLRFLAAGTRFRGEIRFQNLHPAELGALLWALSLGETSAFAGAADRGGLCHSGGRARGLSFGSLYPAAIAFKSIEVHAAERTIEAASIRDQSLADFAQAVYGIEPGVPWQGGNDTRALTRLRNFCNPERSGAANRALGLGQRRANDAQFREYVRLRDAIERGPNSLRENDELRELIVNAANVLD